MPTLRFRTELDHPVEEVFAWHARPGAFERLTPPWRSVRVLERRGGLDEGRVRLRVGRRPAAFDWELRHTAYRENRLFRDEQVSGPFARWSHEHRFDKLGEGRCAVEDEVHWELPGGRLAGRLAAPFGRRELERLFRFRHRRLREDLDRHAAAPGTGRLRVAISGASGLLGSALRRFLEAGGHRAVALVRDRDAARGRPDRVHWSVEEGVVDAAALEGIDAVVHLAGEPLYALRWTEAKKRRIRDSRKRGTALLSRALAGLDRPPAVLVSASGVNYYGRRGHEPVDEGAPPGEGFLADVCRAWEGATAPAEEAGIRVVRLRTGIVLTPAGGALRLMLPAFRAGLGGAVGSGKQAVSWIDPDDYLGLVLHALGDGGLRGPVNATSPHAVTMRELARTLGRVLRRPALLRVPGPLVRLAAGEMGEEMLLDGARVLPRKARAAGFTYLRPRLEACLRFQLGRNGSPRSRAPHSSP